MKALSIITACVVSASAGAQQPATKIPVRQIAPPDASSRERLKSVEALVQFPDGRVLVGANRIRSVIAK